MTRDHAIDPDITTEEEFEVALNRLLRAAFSNDLDPRGGWVARDGERGPFWEVTVVELSSEKFTD